MKTLRQYVVNGGLFAGDGKTPAAVGDQVRLYLDTEAHADFPEFIVGTIQHPVAPILAGTAISYSFEYDEDDLLDVVANLIVADVISVTITSAVDILAANNTGVNTGNETAESVLGLLADQDVEVASIGLSDGTGTALAAGSLTLNAAGEVVVHDFESNAEDLPHLVNSRASIDLATVATAANMQSATFSRLLCEVPLTVAQIANGKKLHLAGLLRSIWGAGLKPDGSATLVICRDGQDPLADGLSFLFAEGVSSERRDFQLPFVFSVATGTWTLAVDSAEYMAHLTKTNGATITHDRGWSLGIDFGEVSPITGAAGEPVKLLIYLITSNTSATVAANLFVSGHLTAISQ